MLEYGNTGDSYIEAGHTAANVWAVNRISDTVGNFLTVSYNEDAFHYTPKNISYAGNSVRFQYQPRPDVTSTYQAGAQIQNTERLGSIQTFASVAGVSTLVRDYRLGYDNNGSAGRTRLISLTECAGDGVCLPATRFAWQGGGSVAFGNDFRGPLFTNAAGWGADQHNATIAYPDLNGDGRPDLCARDINGIQCQLGTGSGFGSPFRGPAFSDAAGWDQPQHYSTIAYPDLNGDGQADICARGTSGICCLLGTGSGFGAVFNGPVFSDAAGWDEPQHYSTIAYPDLNGDGKADILCTGH